MSTLIRRSPDRRSRRSRRASRETGSEPIQIVVTPGSGNGSAMTTAFRLRDALAGCRRPARLDAFGDLRGLYRWARTDDRPFSTLVCVGGDGTQSAAAAAAMRRSAPFLAVPSGFGNLFARALDAPSSVAGVLDLLARGRVIHADVGVRNGEPFLCQRSYGLIVEVQDAVEAGVVPRARWQRWLAYHRAALRQLRAGAPARLRVTVDGRVVAVDAALVVVANVKTYGAWLPLTPDASPVDGLLDVFVMTGASHRRVLLGLLRRYLRVPGAESGTLLCRGRQVSVSGLPATRDQLEVLGHRLPVIVSPETASALERGVEPRSLDALRVPGWVA